MTDVEKREKIAQLKEEIRKAEFDYNYYNAIQLAWKLIMNGSYGAFANQHFVVSNKFIANAITSHGRDVILYMITVIEDYFFNKWHQDVDIHKLLAEKYIAKTPKGEYCMINIHNKIVGYPKNEISELLKVWHIDRKDLIQEERKIIIDNEEYEIIAKRKIHDFSNVDKIPMKKSKLRESFKINEQIKYDLYFHDVDLAIYSDTDSIYLSYKPIMDSCGYSGNSLEFILNMDFLFIGDYFNKALDVYASRYKVKNLHDFELEKINQAGLHLKKKHYINNVVWADNIFYEPLDYFDIKGISIIRSESPPFVRGDYNLDDEMGEYKKGIWKFIRYIFENAGHLNIQHIQRIIKDLKKEFIFMGSNDIDLVAMSTSLSNYENKVLDDQTKCECVKGAHFSVKAACFHNFLLNKNSEYKSKYDLLKSGKIKYYFINHPLNDRLAYLRNFHPTEICEKEGIDIDWDRQFEVSLLALVNRFLEPIGLPYINRRIGVLNSLISVLAGSTNQSTVKDGVTIDDLEDYANELTNGWD
jgi:hypothetical protein